MSAREAAVGTIGSPAKRWRAGAGSVVEVFEYGGLAFEWDPVKAEANIAKHGVAFEDAATSFADTDATVVPDRRHSRQEERWLQVAVSDSGQLLLTGYTHRDSRIRIISARPATRRERHEYVQGPRRRRR
jgi:uncharacterized DUF497 family protein